MPIPQRRHQPTPKPSGGGEKEEPTTDITQVKEEADLAKVESTHDTHTGGAGSSNHDAIPNGQASA